VGRGATAFCNIRVGIMDSGKISDYNIKIRKSVYFGVFGIFSTSVVVFGLYAIH